MAHSHVYSTTVTAPAIESPLLESPTAEWLLADAIDNATRSWVPAAELKGEKVIDPVDRLMDPTFTEKLWYYEHSKIGDEIPGQLHAKQLEALIHQTRHKWLFWGNQAGKTTVGAVDLVLKALGRHPLQKAGILRMPPRTAWASALTWELWENILLPELLTWIPLDRILSAPQPNKKSTRRDILIRADNGKVSRITGKAAEQGAAKYQSARVDDVWLDEEHPEPVWNEIQPRLLRHGGHTFATMTPLLGFTWVHAKVYERIRTGGIPPERHWYSHAGVADNPAIAPADIEEMTEELKHNPSQLAARLHGFFVRPFGAVLPWDPEKHLTKPFELTPERMVILRIRGAWYGSLDLGKWRFAFAFGVADADGAFLMIDEYFSQNESPDVRAKGMHDLMKKWAVPDSIMIPADCADPKGINELNEAFERLGSPYRVYPIAGELKSKTTGIARVENMMNRGAFRVRRGMGADMTWYLGRTAGNMGKPVMGSRWMWEAANWQYPKTEDGKIQKDEPDDASADGADMMDITRYLIVSFFPAEAPLKPKKHPTTIERLAKELEELDKQDVESEEKGDDRFGPSLRQ